jgi:hypothetical protein
MDNQYITTIEKHIAKRGLQSGIERGTAWVCSLFLSREFNETEKHFHARNPKIAEFSAWLEAKRAEVDNEPSR